MMGVTEGGLEPLTTSGVIAVVNLHAQLGGLVARVPSAAPGPPAPRLATGDWLVLIDLLGLQAAILVAQDFQGENVFQRDCGDPRHRAEKVHMVIFELGPGTRSQEVKNSDGFLDRNQRNAKHAFGIAGFGSGPAEDGRTFP